MVYVFCLIVESLKVVVYVKVEGDNVYYMIEGCFKVFGCVLCQVVQIEGDCLLLIKEYLV